MIHHFMIQDWLFRGAGRTTAARKAPDCCCPRFPKPERTAPLARVRARGCFVWAGARSGPDSSDDGAMLMMLSDRCNFDQPRRQLGLSSLHRFLTLLLGPWCRFRGGSSLLEVS